MNPIARSLRLRAETLAPGPERDILLLAAAEIERLHKLVTGRVAVTDALREALQELVALIREAAPKGDASRPDKDVRVDIPHRICRAITGAALQEPAPVVQPESK